MEITVLNQEKVLELEKKLDHLAEMVKALGSKDVGDGWLNTDDVGKIIGVSPRTLQAYRDKGMIPYSKIGRTVRYRRRDVERFMLNHRRNDFLHKRKGGNRNEIGDE